MFDALKYVVAILAGAYLTLAPAAGDTTVSRNPLAPPPVATVAEARAIVAQMIASPKGPYQRIRWFCNDGAVLPPEPFACREHGGGRQHGEYSSQRWRLAELGWHAGTVFAGMEYSEFLDAGLRNARLRELALERYLTDIDDGWVLRKARDYRGRVQIEDEESSGRELLLELLADPIWVGKNYLLARETVRVVPHAGSNDPTRNARRTATELAERDRSFERLRVEIHTAPNAGTADRVRSWRESVLDESLRDEAATLAGVLDEIYGTAGRRQRLERGRATLQKNELTRPLAQLLLTDAEQLPSERIRLLSACLARGRSGLLQIDDAKLALAFLDITTDLEAEINVSAAEVLSGPAMTRRELLELARSLIDAGYGVGLISRGERRVLRHELDTAIAASATGPDGYLKISRLLRRVPQWSVGTVRYTFAEPLVNYSALDPRAARFSDDLLRGSALMPMGEISRRIARDAERMSGVRHAMNGRPMTGAFALNPGVASGRLRVFEDSAMLEADPPEHGDIVVLPETVAELTPVAGIITMGEGNPLSHVQLLARNFGIPNVAILPGLLPELLALNGMQVMLAVSAAGDVVLENTQRAGHVPDDSVTGDVPPLITVARPDLSLRAPLALAELNASLSGRVIGPKAANLGELNRLFPGRVAPALALPFGIFAAHLNSGSPGILPLLEDAYEIQTTDERRIALAKLKEEIAALTLDADTVAAVTEMMEAEFGPPDSYGVFVRSDTNVEDLPQFTGAGLNETVPNVVGLERQLATVPRVWSSVLSERAIAWRSQALANPSEVYASVLLMKSVPATKSGVLVTTSLAGPDSGLTVSTAWGIGGAVAGEAAETLLLMPDGELLLSEAKTPWQRNLAASGGIEWTPAPDGPVLESDEKSALRDLADEVARRYAPVNDENGHPRPWDIEFGFVDGELTLFQIRPLVQRGSARADQAVQRLLGEEARTAAADAPDMDAPPFDAAAEDVLP